jgi:hypothetical protein
MGEFVDQLDFCILMIRPSFVLQAFSQNKVSWHLLYFKIFYFAKTGAKTYTKTKGFTKTKYL